MKNEWKSKIFVSDQEDLKASNKIADEVFELLHKDYVAEMTEQKLIHHIIDITFSRACSWMKFKIEEQKK